MIWKSYLKTLQQNNQLNPFMFITCISLESMKKPYLIYKLYPKNKIKKSIKFYWLKLILNLTIKLHQLK